MHITPAEVSLLPAGAPRPTHRLHNFPVDRGLWQNAGGVVLRDVREGTGVGNQRRRGVLVGRELGADEGPIAAGEEDNRPVADRAGEQPDYALGVGTAELGVVAHDHYYCA